MRAKATITIPPIPLGQRWTFGWVQACSSMDFINIYGHHGFSSWEFPQLNLGMAAVNDSDGNSYPFYGHGQEIFKVMGPTTEESTFEVSMSDSPASHVSLRIPKETKDHGSVKVAAKRSSIEHRTCSSIDLSCIKREQKFLTWLVALNECTTEIIELKCIVWDLDVQIDIVPDVAAGWKPIRKEHLNTNVKSRPIKVPEAGKIAPDANHAQMLVWRPYDSNEPQHSRSICINVPPRVKGRAFPTERELRNPQVYALAKELIVKHDCLTKQCLDEKIEDNVDATAMEGCCNVDAVAM